MDLWNEGFNNTNRIVEQGRMIYDEIQSHRDERTDIIICPMHMGDTLWSLSLIGAYRRSHDCDSVYVVVKEGQDELPSMFEDIDGFISITADEMNCLSYYIVANQLWNCNHIVFSFRRACMAVANPEYSIIYYSSRDDVDKETKFGLGLSDDSQYAGIKPFAKNDELVELFKDSVLLIPVAQTMESPPDSFWSRLASSLTELGYEVYTNYNGFEYEKEIEGTKPLSSSMSELAQIGPCFKSVISVRSGACDLLVMTDTDLSVIYPKSTNDKRVELAREETRSALIYELNDNGKTKCYQYRLDLEDMLVESLLSGL